MSRSCTTTSSEDSPADEDARETRHILDTLEAQHPDADTELHYRNAFELLVATILSAQSTDERVNLVTPALFTRYPNAQALAKATHRRARAADSLDRLLPREVEGAHRHGAGARRATTAARCRPTWTRSTTLPGVGRKTANVVLGHALGVPGLPVDRHVLRVANRIGIAESDDPEVVEQQLCGALPPERWTRTSDTLILHGRRICRPKPLCDQCAVHDDCDYFATAVARAIADAARSPREQKPP